MGFVNETIEIRALLEDVWALAGDPGRIEVDAPSSTSRAGGSALTTRPDCVSGSFEAWYAASLRPKLAQAARDGRVSPLRAARLERAMGDLFARAADGGGRRGPDVAGKEADAHPK